MSCGTASSGLICMLFEFPKEMWRDEEKVFEKIVAGASLVVQWLRIHLPIQGTRVRSLAREDATCRRATKPMGHNYWACSATTTEAHTPRARAPQQEKPLQWEVRAPQRRVAPAGRN